MARRSISSNVTCVYCLGSIAADTLTVEHLIPKSLYKAYIKENPKAQDFLIRIPSCKGCNSLKAQFDEKFKNLMVITNSHLSHESETLLASVTNAYNRNPDFRALLQDNNLKVVNYPGTDESVLRLQDNGIEVFKYLKYIVKGVMFIEENKLLNKSLKLKIFQFDPLQRKMFDPKFIGLTEMGYKTRKQYTDKIFQYAIQETKDFYIILLSFFQFSNLAVLVKKSQLI